MAGGPGIEPGFLEPKSNVLPLDDPPTRAIPYPAMPYSVKSFVRHSLLVAGRSGTPKRCWIRFTPDSLRHPSADNPMAIVGDIDEQSAEIHFSQMSRDFIFGKRCPQ